MEHIMESIGFMLSKDFKKRMKAEYWQLALRCEKLEEMCRKYEGAELYAELQPYAAARAVGGNEGIQGMPGGESRGGRD